MVQETNDGLMLADFNIRQVMENAAMRNVGKLIGIEPATYSELVHILARRKTRILGDLNTPELVEHCIKTNRTLTREESIAKTRKVTGRGVFMPMSGERFMRMMDDYERPFNVIGRQIGVIVDNHEELEELMAERGTLIKEAPLGVWTEIDRKRYRRLTRAESFQKTLELLGDPSYMIHLPTLYTHYKLAKKLPPEATDN